MTTTHTTPRLGIDIGRVLLGAADTHGRGDTSFLSGTDAAALATPPTPGALDAVARLVARLDGRVWLVSKCGRRIEALTLRWLDHHRFYERTGMPRDHVRFCRARPDKRVHAEALGLTHFVDDRLEVLEHLCGVVPQLYLFGHQKPGTPRPAFATPVCDWMEALTLLLEDLDVAERHVRDEPHAVR